MLPTCADVEQTEQQAFGRPSPTARTQHLRFCSTLISRYDVGGSARRRLEPTAFLALRRVVLLHSPLIPGRVVIRVQNEYKKNATAFRQMKRTVPNPTRIGARQDETAYFPT